MTPYLNEGYEETNTNSDMVLVNMLPFNAGLRVKGKKRTRLERGMIVTFRFVFLPPPFLCLFFFPFLSCLSPSLPGLLCVYVCIFADI